VLDSGIDGSDSPELAIPAPNPPSGHRRSRTKTGLVLRLAALIGLTLLGFGGVFYDVVRSIGGGSRAAYLLVIPVLMVMIAYGRRTEAIGVNDNEADWILGLLLGGFALFLTYLADGRFPTLTGMWNLPLVGAAIWTAFAATILFGFRRVWQLWPLWIFATVTVTPFPALLFTAALGGTTAAASAVAAMIGALAVFLAGWPRPVKWRVFAAVGCGLVGVAAATVLPSTSLPVSVGITGGLIPVLSFVLLQRFTTADRRQLLLGGVPARDEGSGRDTPEPAPWPHRSPLALVLLAVVASSHLVLTNSAAAATPGGPLAHADSDWSARAGFAIEQDFGFIHRYLGPDSTFTRYLPPPERGYPAAAVDVITASSLEALRTTRYVVWYPATSVPNYRFTDLGAALPGALVLATDSSAATDGNADDWYALTWVWTVGETYQQVFVIVSQQPSPQAPPPPRPTPPSLKLTVLAPLLWMSRQQADPGTMVDEIVSDRARHVANEVLLAAKAEHPVGPT
jgi:hypothetical protein